jgi:hypothetical protein
MQDTRCGMQDAGCGMQDVGCKPRVRVFQWPGSVFGARCSALGADPVPGIRSQVPGTRHRSRSNAEGRIPGAERGYRAPDSVFGLRFSAFGLDEACGKVASPSPLIPPWPRAGYRTPKTESETRIRGLHPTSCILYPASCIPHVRVFRRQVAGARFQVPGTWHLGPGTGSTPRAGYRAPKTESEGQVPENAHPGFASCI